MDPSPQSNPPPTEADELPSPLLARLRINIPGYKLLSPINHGGQAIVFKAIQENTGRTVAIKLLREGPLADETARERMQREVRVLAALNHPNIVSVFDSGQTPDGHDYLVMNYLSGRSLEEFMKESRTGEDPPPDPAMLLRLFLKICDAVNAAHMRGITHRDLSPSNIVIDERNEPHILDFGLARTAFDRFITVRQKDISVTGQFLGKLAYASPEQARGEPDKIDIRTDVYALGVILYQILTGGNYPYKVVGNIAEVLNNIIHTKPTPPSELISARDASKVQRNRRMKQHHPPAVNAIIEAIVLKGLEKDPANRYQSAGELGKDVSNYLAGQPTVAKPQSPNSRQRRMLPVGIGITAIVLIAVIAWTVLKPAATPPKPVAVDLLSQVRLPANAVRGIWTSTGVGYQSDNTITACLNLPYTAKGEYDFWVEFTKIDQSVAMVFTFGGRRFVWYLDVSRGTNGTGFTITDETVGGNVWLGDSPSRTMPQLTPGTHMLKLQVRQDRFIGFVDDKAVVQWNVDPSILRIQDRWEVEANGLAIMSNRATAFHKVGIISLPSPPPIIKAMPHRDVVTRPLANRAMGEPIDLLAMLQWPNQWPAQFWEKIDGGYKSLETGIASSIDRRIVRLPYTPDDEYDYRLVFTYDRPESLVFLPISRGKRKFNFVFQYCSGFSVLGLPPYANPHAVFFDEPFLVGRKYALTIQVRKNSIAALINDRVISGFQTDYSDLGDPNRDLDEPFNLGFFATRGTTVHSAQIIPLLPVQRVP